jgi:dihydroxyacetone kinase-like predicted kinase
VFDGRSIAAGEILGLIENKVVVIGAEVEKTVCDLVGRMGGDGDEILTLYYGAGVTGEDAERLGGKITEMFPDIEVTLVSGGQPVYYYIVSLE